MLLPTDATKSKAFSEYKKACDLAAEGSCSQRHFLFLWRKLLPYICVMKPYTDLCDTYQQLSHAITLSTNLPDAKNASKIQEYADDLALAKAERKVYNKQCKTCHILSVEDSSV